MDLITPSLLVGWILGWVLPGRMPALPAAVPCGEPGVSVQPYHHTEQPEEQLSVLFNLIGLMAVPLGERCGGHAAVADWGNW
ncbi:MAG: hypothetical protein WBN89_03500 [Prochlorococcaceae cyanobacterium]